MNAFVDSLKSIDTAILLWINGHNSPALDTVMVAASDTFIWIPLYGVLIYLLIKQYGKTSWLPILFVVLTIVISDQLSSHLIKNMFMRYRPSHNLLIQSQLHIVDDYRGGMYGFVSSHAANTVSLTTIIFLLLRKQYVTTIMFFYVVLVCYSRMYLGVHYPTDIAGGVLIGILSGYIAYGLFTLANKALPNSK